MVIYRNRASQNPNHHNAQYVIVGVDTSMKPNMFDNVTMAFSNTTIAAVTTATAIVGMMVMYRKSKNSSKTIVTKTWATRVVRDHGPLKNIWPNVLYTLEAPGCSMGPPIRNMHIYRVPDGSNRLVIYNGVSINDATVKEIEALGTPTILVVPNWMHREDAAIWKDRFPNMLVVCPSTANVKASEEVNVDLSIEEWVQKEEWSPYVTCKSIDGWAKFELILEVQLEPVGKQATDNSGKIAVLMCDLLFTMVDCADMNLIGKMISWFFDSSIVLPSDPTTTMVVPAVTRPARICAIKNWKAVEQWYRMYAKEFGLNIAVILVGHGVPVVQVNPKEGCTKALEGVADQLIKPRW